MTTFIEGAGLTEFFAIVHMSSITQPSFRPSKNLATSQS